MKLLLFLLAVCIAAPSLGQENSETTYFDANWKKVKKKEKAVYHRITRWHTTEPDKASFTDYYTSGKIQNTGFYSSLKTETKDSVWIWWYENGNKKAEQHYRNGKHEGLHTDWYENGNKAYEVNFLNELPVGIMRKWYENGRLKSEVNYISTWIGVGIEGKAVAYYEDGTVRRESIFDNNKHMSSKCYDEKANAVACETPFYALPSYMGGLPTLNQYLSSNLTYPRKARRKKIQGRVVVGFSVDTDGSVLDVHIVQGLSPDLDAVALRVVGQMPKWKPGYEDGEIVKVKFFQPIKFAL